MGSCGGKGTGTVAEKPIPQRTEAASVVPAAAQSSDAAAPQQVAAPSRESGVKSAKMAAAVLPSAASWGSTGSADDEFAAMPQEELLRLLNEADSRCKETKHRLNAAKKQKREGAGFDAGPSWHGMGETEQAEVRRAFDAFDTDHSGKIETSELKALAQELGHPLGEEELQAVMKELDVNQDGTLDFGEFWGWWNGKRGGSAKLGLVKMSLMQRLITRTVRERIEGAELEALRGRTLARPQSVNWSASIGDREEAKSGSQVRLMVAPSTEVEFEEEVRKLMGADYKMSVYDEEEDEAAHMFFHTAVDFKMRDGVTGAAVDHALARVESALDVFREEALNDKGIEVRLEKTAGPGVRMLVAIRAPEDEHPILKLQRQARKLLGRNIEMSEIFETVGGVLSLGVDLSDVVSLDNKDPIIEAGLDVVKNVKCKGHIRASGDLLKIIDAVLFGCVMEDVDDLKESQEKVVGGFAANLFDSVDIQSSSESPQEAYEQLMQMGLDKYQEKCGVADRAKLEQKLRAKLRAESKAYWPVYAWVSVILSKMPDEEEISSAQNAFLRVVEGVSSVRTRTSLHSMSVDLTGFNIARHYMLDDDARTARLEAINQAMGGYDSDSDCSSGSSS